MPGISTLKRMLALLILACFFLPLCQCSGKSEAPTYTESGKLIETPEVKDIVIIPAEIVEFRHLDEIPLLSAFLWPLAAVLLQSRIRRRWGILALNALEIVLAVLSIAGFIHILQFYPELRYGGVLLLGGYACWIIASCIQVYQHAKAGPLIGQPAQEP